MGCVDARFASSSFAMAELERKGCQPAHISTGHGISEVTLTACCRINVGSAPLSVVRVQLRDGVRWVGDVDVGSLLTDAGFKLVTADTDIVHVNFRDAAHAMETLQVC